LVVTDDSAFVVAISSYGFVQVLKLTVVTLEGGKTKAELEFVRSLDTYGGDGIHGIPMDGIGAYFGQPHLALRAVGGRQTLLVVASSHIVEMELDGTFVRTIGFPADHSSRSKDYLAATAMVALPLSGHIAAVDSNTKRVRIFDGESGHELVERAISIPSWGAPPPRWREIIYDGGVPTCDCARYKPRLMPMVEVDGQLVCSCQQCPDEYLNRPVAIAADASDQLIVLDLYPAGDRDYDSERASPCLRVFSAATGKLLSTRKSLFTAGWPFVNVDVDVDKWLDPKIEWVGSLGRLVLADPNMNRVHLFQLPRAECTACGCSREVDDNGERVCFCDPCRTAGCHRSNGHPWSRMRNIARQKDDCQPCQPACSVSPSPRPAPQQHPHPASGLQPWNGARYHHCASECAVCGCANERDGEGERACWCDSCRAGGCQHDDRCGVCGVE
jgi:hypothetical protein